GRGPGAACSPGPDTLAAEPDVNFVSCGRVYWRGTPVRILPMPLDLLELSTQVRQMGELLAQRRADEQRRLQMLDSVLAAYRDRWEELAELAETVQERGAVPTGPLDERVPPAPRPATYAPIAPPGAATPPDRQ